MYYARCVLFFVVVAQAASVQATWLAPFISEIHYDNAGSDSGEFVAVTASAGHDFTDWRLDLYNGTGGGVYGSVSLSGIASGLTDWVESSWSVSGLQNGPDAVALVSPLSGLVDFIAYEATFEATAGIAAGEMARLLPVAESGATPVGDSLQRFGGSDEWLWRAAASTRDVLNPGLVLAAAQAQVASTDVRGLLLIGGLAFGLTWRGRRRAAAC